MFISQVYKYSKGLCAAMILFVAGQLFINYKRGMVVSPFYHYGMYSHEIKVKKNYDVFEVKVNGKLLRGSDYTPQQWDKIMLPVQYYSTLNRNNELYENEIKRLLARLHISTNQQQYVQQCNYESFEKWYNQYLETVLNEPVTSSQISLHQYSFAGSLQPTDSVINLAQLCH